jgi:hypothetical protein
MSSITNKKTDQHEHHHQFSSSFADITQFATVDVAVWLLESSSSSYGFFFCYRKSRPTEEEEEAQERVKQHEFFH